MSLSVQEKRQLQIAKELRSRTVNKLWKITEELNILYRENWTVLADKEMVKFQNELLSGKLFLLINRIYFILDFRKGSIYENRYLIMSSFF